MAEHQELLSAIEAVKLAPSESTHWDRVEALLDSVQRPSDVSALFRTVLSGEDIDADLASDIGQRAVRFYEVWYGEDSSELPETLERVLHIDPRAEWAFQRLTVAYTVAERWTDLLAAYDRAIAQAEQTTRRTQLLEEAAQVAKDFASLPERAIDYMNQLIALDPSNGTLANTLERLLERQERYQDLITLYEARIGVQTKAQVRETRVRMAAVLFQRLGDAEGALAQLRTVLTDQPEHAEALALVRELMAASAAPVEVRDACLQWLKRHYLHRDERLEVIAVLEASLEFVRGEARASTLRELVDRLTGVHEYARALPYQAALLQLDPEPKEREGLLALAQRTRDYEHYQTALRDAAKVAPPDVAVELLMEAGRALEQDVGDLVRAIDCYGQVFVAAPGALTLTAGRRLIALLEQTDQEPALLEASTRLADLETDEVLRRRLLGKVALLAEKLGDRSRAQRAWSTRVAEDAGDVEALDALVRHAAEDESWPRLAELLDMRVQAPGAAHRRRDDLVWLAGIRADQLDDVDGAIAAWRGIQDAYGEDHETVNALTVLLSRAQRWQELADILKQAAASEIVRFTELQAQLGDAYRLRLGRPLEAALRYRSALQVDPRCAVARAGQAALLDDEDCRAVAADSLAEAYQQTDEWQALLGLLEPRLSTESSSTVRAEILIEAAGLYEEHADDPAAALSCLRRAFALIPDDRSTEREIRRLAESLSAWEAVVEAYRETIATFEEPTPRVAELRYDEGEVLEHRIGDREAALLAYQQAADVAPGRSTFAEAVLRLAGLLGRHDVAARCIINHARAQGQLDQQLFSGLERVVAGSDDFGAFARALMAALGDAALPGPLARELYCQVAQFELTKRDDRQAAEAALRAACEADPEDLATLKRLASVQRENPGRPLVATLLKLADKEMRNLDSLYEACDVALDHLGDIPLALPILQRLHETAASMFKYQREASGEQDSQSMVTWALERLVRILREEKQPQRALHLLSEAATLPFDVEATQGLRHEAAKMAAQGANDSLRAIGLYRDILQVDPRDKVAIEALAGLFRAEDRLPELLSLRSHELGLSPSPEQQLTLRLSIAEILGQMEARGGRLQLLQENLRQVPGHRSSVEEATKVLRAKGAYVELAELLERQARQLTQLGQGQRAAELWESVAVLQEVELDDSDRALSAYEALFDLQPQGSAAEALARLHAERDEHSRAADWLALRLGTVEAERRPEIALWLAKAYIAAEQPPRARATLEQLLVEAPEHTEARGLLSDLYRQNGDHQALAQLLLGGVDHVFDDAEKLGMLTEVANLYHGPLASPELAIPALERARALSADDDELAVMLAAGLRAAERYDEAAAALQQLIDRQGRKRSVGRAELHFQLASVLYAAGDRDSAVAELETATRMDLAHASALHMLAQMTHEAGDLDRAERAYRGLLMLVRRRDSVDVDEVGPSEVFYALHGIAKERDNGEQATELLQSALEAAAHNDLEARRFQRAVGEGDAELLLQVLDLRLSREPERAAEAEILGTKAEVLDAKLGRGEEAFEVLLQALALAPQHDGLHESARRLAVRLDGLPRLMQTYEHLVERAYAAGDAEGKRSAAGLLLKMGATAEQELSDLDRAASIFRRVEESGECVVEAWLALARVAGARGASTEQRRVLLRIAELPAAEASAAERAAALYALAELSLEAEALSTEDALVHLQRGLELHPDYPRAQRLLLALLERCGEDAPLLAVLRQVAVASDDASLLLRWHLATAGQSGSSLAQIREGVDLARREGESASAEALLKSASQLVVSTQPTEPVMWVFFGLADSRQQAGDISGAIQYLQQALPYAAPEEAYGVRRRLAELSSGEGGDLAVAAEAYEGMLQHEPTDRAIWAPLMEIYRKRGDQEAFDAFVARVEDALLLEEDRISLRVAQARFLIDVSHAELSAVEPLNAVLADQPAHAEAIELLSGIYQRQGMDAELRELLSQQFDRARDEQDLRAVGELGLRLGKLHAQDQPEEALGIYRSALEWVPNSRELLHACLESMGPDTDMRERAEVMLALLQAGESNGAQAVLELVDQWVQLGDDSKVLQTLELGLAAEPENLSLRERLRAYYREQGDWAQLADFCKRTAVSCSNPQEAIAAYREAAAIYRDELDELPAAAEALRAALALAPEDLTLLAEVSRNLAAAGQTEQALAEVDRLLADPGAAHDMRLQLLVVRADLLQKVERHADAVRDLEEAHQIDAEQVRAGLIEALEVLKGQALIEGERARERAATLRLVQLHDLDDDREQGRQLLAEWCETEPNDLEALRALRRRDEAEERYEDVAETCQRLLELEEGEARVDAALGLVDAYSRLDRLQEARQGLEQAYRDMPNNGILRSRLLQLYEALGALPEQADILLAQGQEEAADTATRMAHLRRAAELFLELDQANSALQALSIAQELDPADQQSQILMIDIQIKLGQFDDARATLATAMDAHKRRRSPELALLQQRMARLCATLGDSGVQLQWLQQALDTDRRNGQIAAELVEVAIALEDYEAAMKALRSITMMEDPQPITRAMAFLKQAQIAVVRGDARRAQHWARKAKTLDETLTEADALLAELG